MAKRDDATRQTSRADGLRMELRLWRVAGFCVSFVPLGCLLLLRREEYFVGYTGLRVGCGVTVVLVICLLLALGKAKLPGRVVCLWGLVGVIWLIIPLLQDMLLMLVLLAVGVTLDELICQTRARSLERQLERAERREDITAAVRAAGEGARSDGE